MSLMERFRTVGQRLLTRRHAGTSSFAENIGIQAEGSSYFKRLVQRMSENQKNNDEMASRRVNGREKRVLPAGVASIVASTALFSGPMPQSFSMQRISSESPVTTVAPQSKTLSPAERYAGGPAVDVQVNTQTGRTRVSVQYGQASREGEREQRVRVDKKNAAVAKPEPISRVDSKLPQAEQRVRVDKKNAAVAKPEPISRVDPKLPQAEQRVRVDKKNAAVARPASNAEQNCVDEFCPIDSKGHMLGREAALAFKRAQAEAGVEIFVNSALRSSERQQELFDCWQAGEPGCNPANPPGSSYHESGMGGLAVDVENHENPAVNEALKRNGFNQPFPDDPQEDHHFCYSCNG
jgi:LAS superfamily LD-carboxypeptidase LdcB